MTRRQAIIDRLTAQILGREPDAPDEFAGRQQLIGYEQVKAWMDYWSQVKYLPA